MVRVKDLLLNCESPSAFRNQFYNISNFGALTPGKSGSAVAYGKSVKKVAPKQPAPTTKKEDKANKKALKAANKPTKASNTTIGNNEKVSVEARRRALKNEPPARPNRIRGGGLRSAGRLGGGGAMNWSTK